MILDIYYQNSHEEEKFGKKFIHERGGMWKLVTTNNLKIFIKIKFQYFF